mmetsp:Transcript_54779/g.154202  ORF Transcript_54779/g.154202 Transcript_54779/m.154202 type:complete len:296 (-) Transcript_54779:76-963(-)
MGSNAIWHTGGVHPSDVVPRGDDPEPKGRDKVGDVPHGAADLHGPAHSCTPGCACWHVHHCVRGHTHSPARKRVHSGASSSAADDAHCGASAPHAAEPGRSAWAFRSRAARLGFAAEASGVGCNGHHCDAATAPSIRCVVPHAGALPAAGHDAAGDNHEPAAPSAAPASDNGAVADGDDGRGHTAAAEPPEASRAPAASGTSTDRGDVPKGPQHTPPAVSGRRAPPAVGVGHARGRLQGAPRHGRLLGQPAGRRRAAAASTAGRHVTGTVQLDAPGGVLKAAATGPGRCLLLLHR